MDEETRAEFERLLKENELGRERDRLKEVSRHNLEAERTRACKRANGHSAPASPLILDLKNPMQSARELVNAHFTEGERQPILYRHRSSFWKYQGSCYRPLDEDAIRAKGWAFLDAALIERKDEKVQFKPNRARVSDMLDAVKSICHLDGQIEPPAWLDGGNQISVPAMELFAVGNGLLHLPTGQLFFPTPSYFGLSASDVQFDPDAPEPTQWFAFLEGLFGNDIEAITTLQEWFGYTLSPDTSQQKIVLMEDRCF